MANIFEELGFQLDKENYFTNCLSLLFKQDPTLRDAILADFLNLDMAHINHLQISDITPQERFSNGRIADLVLRDKFDKVLIVIENKVDAPADRKQLNDYLTEQIEPAAKRGSESWLVLLSRDDERREIGDVIDHNLFRFARWSDLYRVLSLYSDRRRLSSEYVEMFLEFLRRRGIQMTKPLRADLGQTWNEFVDFAESAEYIMKEAAPQIEELPPTFKRWETEYATDMTYRPNPYIGRWFSPRQYRGRKQNIFWLWFGFMQTRKGVVVQTEYKFPDDVYEEVQNHKTELERWRGILHERGWRDGPEFKEDAWEMSRVFKSATLAKVLTGSKALDAQIQRVVDFATQCFRDLRDARTYAIFERAMAEM